MFGRTVYEQANMPRTVITDDMAKAITRWVALYRQEAPWLMKNPLSLGLPAALAQVIANLVTNEAQITVTDDTPKPKDPNQPPTLNPRAQFIEDSLKPLLEALPIRTEYACAFGGVVFKPYIDDGKVFINVVNADDFYPTTFNPRGKITGAVFIERKRSGEYTFIRVEHHELVDDKLIITNQAYRAHGNANDIGSPISLTDVPEWAEIQPRVEINSDRPLFAYFKIPQGNVVDDDSLLGVSVFARADKDNLIEEADKQWQRLSWEYHAGEMAVHASDDAFKKLANGLPVLPEGFERLYRRTNLDPKTTDKGAFDVYNPDLRDENYYNGLNKILQRIEDVSGIARGTFSDVNEQAKTATEIINSKQRTYSTVSTIQRALQAALEELAGVIDDLATLYNLAPAGEYELNFVWDDSIIVDAEAERMRDMQEVNDGLMAKWEYRKKWYGESEEDAKAAIAAMNDRSFSDDEMMTFSRRRNRYLTENPANGDNIEDGNGDGNE